MILRASPRLSQSTWSDAQKRELTQMWMEIMQVVNANAPAPTGLSGRAATDRPGHGTDDINAEELRRDE